MVSYHSEKFLKVEVESYVVFDHRRRMEREAKAKVVAAVWGQNLLNSYCHASCFASVDLEEKVEFIA